MQVSSFSNWIDLQNYLLRWKVLSIFKFDSEYHDDPILWQQQNSLFVKNNLRYILRKYLILFNKSIECLFIALQNTDSSRSNSIIVGVIYRPPSTNIIHFNEALSTLLDKMKMENKQVYLSGDFNINLINTDKHQPSGGFLESMFSYPFYPMINRPTWIRESSATLIDNIFSNVLKPNLLTGILYTDISDHFPVFIIDHDQRAVGIPQYITARQYSEKKYFIISVQTSTDRLK